MDQYFSPPPPSDRNESPGHGTATVGSKSKNPPAREFTVGINPEVGAHRRGEAPTLTSVTPVYQSQGTQPTAPAQPEGSTLPTQTATGTDSESRTATGTNDSTPEPTASPRSLRLRKKKRRSRVRLRHLLPAWSVSLLVHVVILSALAAATFTNQESRKPVSFDSALAANRQGVLETLPILADPANLPRDEAIGKEHGGLSPTPAVMMLDDEEEGEGGGAITAMAFGSSSSTASRFLGAGKRKINEANSLPNFKFEGMGGSPLNTLPPTPEADLFGGGRIGGDPTFVVKEIGDALDQLSREILRHLKDHKLTVVWLFDQSASMRDDQRTILDKFDRVSLELKKHIEPGKKAAGALNHAILGFGETIDFEVRKPTLDIDEINRGIKRLRTDQTGVENTMRAIRTAVDEYAGLINKKDRKLMLVLVTDESGDDGADVEEARQALKKFNVPLFVIGRQSLFGYAIAHHRYQDPVTKDVYNPQIRRGPETADVEIYQWDGLYDRWDEQPSGFAPWELARLTAESGGIYFLLPTEEFMRLRDREKAYSITQLKEYQPEYDNRMVYVQNRTKSELRRSLFQIITETKGFIYRREFPIEAGQQAKAAGEEAAKATYKLNSLLEIQKHLELLKGVRDREPQRRWQAHYDLILAQTVAFQVKAFEYRALMEQLAQKPRATSKLPTPDLAITFVVNHSGKSIAPAEMTAKKYVEAKRLLQDVIVAHPRTPWADLAKDTLDRGFSVQLDEWHHNPKFQERAHLVPKY